MPCEKVTTIWMNNVYNDSKYLEAHKTFPNRICHWNYFYFYFYYSPSSFPFWFKYCGSQKNWYSDPWSSQKWTPHLHKLQFQQVRCNKRTIFAFHIYISRAKVRGPIIGTSKSFLWPLNWLRINPSKLQVLKLHLRCRSHNSPKCRKDHIGPLNVWWT